MCKLGGIVLLHTKKGWEVKEWKNGHAPEHEHFFWDHAMFKDPKDRMSIYPKLKDFGIGQGIIIGVRHDVTMLSVLPYYLLDGIELTKGGENDKQTNKTN